MDTALKSKVILCSPITLYAVLSVMRQAVENFNIKRATGDILSLHGTFKQRWDKYCDSFKDLGDKIEAVQSEYNALTTTRTKMLDVPVRKIEKLRSQRSIPPATLTEEDELLVEEDEELHDL